MVLERVTLNSLVQTNFRQFQDKHHTAQPEKCRNHSRANGDNDNDNSFGGPAPKTKLSSH